MSRRSALAVTGGLLLTLVMALPAAAGQRAASWHVFTVVEHATTDTVVDNAPTGDSLGDLLAFGNKLFNANDTRRAGRDEGFCVRTKVGVAWECSWTNILSHGQITVQGPFRDDGSDTWLAITGGTGRYASARGQMRLHWRDAIGSAFDFEFHIRY